MKRNQIISYLTALMLCVSSMGIVSCTKNESSEPVISQTDVTTVTANDVETEPYTAEGLTFSAKSGFYPAEFLLTITSESGAEIHYTLDGSTPDADSPLYDGPIRIADRSAEPNRLSAYTNISPETGQSKVYPPEEPVDKATVVRASAVDEQGGLHPAVTNTYFIGYDEKASFYSDMKIMSLVTDEQNLFDEETGIYVLGKTHTDWKNSDEYDAGTPEYSMPANYTQKGKEWEREACLEIFENGQSAIAQNVGIRIHGGATRSYPQKSLNIYARAEYGAPKMDYDLFSGAVLSESSGEAITEYDSFMLRNGGNDAQFARFRDRLNQTLVSDRKFLTQGMEPCILFINGEFWGQYDITERIDTDYIKAHCGVSKKDICIIKKEQLDAGPETAFDEWQALREKIAASDFSDPAVYDEICSSIDMQSFMDYVCAELYFNNDNWGRSNMAMWKSTAVDPENPYADGKWRFIMYDTDYSAGIYGEANANDDSLTKLMESDSFLGELLCAAMKNEQFYADFSAVCKEIAEVNFAAERVTAQIDAFSAEYHDSAAATLHRFWSRDFSISDAEMQFENEVQSVRRFFAGRQLQFSCP